jgi:hypothetical protein
VKLNDSLLLVEIISLIEMMIPASLYYLALLLSAIVVVVRTSMSLVNRLNLVFVVAAMAEKVYCQL